MNPHFLFNALNTISAITGKHPDLAKSLLQHLSRFLRLNLKRNTELVTLSEELERINAYLHIEKARFSTACRSILIYPPLLGLRIPTFTLQPIENAVKHGTSQLLSQGTIEIETDRHQELLTLTIKDNALFNQIIQSPLAIIQVLA